MLYPRSLNSPKWWNKKIGCICKAFFCSTTNKHIDMSAASSSSAMQGMLYLVHTMAKLACYCLGLIIPSYETYKVATTQKKSDNPDDWINSHKKWIAYWTFYFFYTYLVEYLLEHYIVQQLEFYYELRLVVITILLYTNVWKYWLSNVVQRQVSRFMSLLWKAFSRIRKRTLMQRWVLLPRGLLLLKITFAAFLNMA